MYVCMSMCAGVCVVINALSNTHAAFSRSRDADGLVRAAHLTAEQHDRC